MYFISGYKTSNWTQEHCDVFTIELIIPSTQDIPVSPGTKKVEIRGVKGFDSPIAEIDV